MQAVCPKCNTLNPIDNKFCGSCGASLETAKVVQEVRGEEPETQPQKSRGALWLVLAIIIACVLLWIGLRAGSDTPSSHSASGAWSVTQQFVEDRLVSPATAEFPVYSYKFTKHLGDGRYRVEAYVDSQNRMGGLVRTYFIAEVQWIGDENWRLESIQFDE